MKTLHSLNVTCDEDQLQRLDLTQRWPTLQKLLHSLQQEKVLSFNTTVLQHVLQSLPTSYEEPRPKMLVHGDLYARHLIIEQGQLRGIHRGDPALDLAAVYTCLPTESHATFWQEYGPVSPETLSLAGFQALYSAAMILNYGLHEQDQALFAAGQQAMLWLQQLC
ncbi:MAG: hypothetical protein IGS03_08150 [Candidatus Sericytochromatia bacterium]|nr:hypothetical protein [Candidatus Sericytochromatia bacterium]